MARSGEPLLDHPPGALHEHPPGRRLGQRARLQHTRIRITGQPQKRL
jgi:hypothetical protein